MNIINSKKLKILVILLFQMFFIFSSVQAAGLLKSDTAGDTNDLATKVAENSMDTNIQVGALAATLIKAFLSLLGIIFLVLILIGGWKYFNARGDEAKVDEALDTIKHAVIGLVIIIGAYAITYFIFSNLPGGSGSSSGNSFPL